MAERAMSIRKGVLTLVVFPAVFFAVVASLPLNTPNFSEEHRANIHAIALQICSSAQAEPCPLTWGSKSKWFGTIATHRVPSAYWFEALQAALPSPEWAFSSGPSEFEWENGSYVVIYHSAHGRIDITSARVKKQ
jgi:hypothetical protein